MAALLLVVSVITRILLVYVHGGWPASNWAAVGRAFATGLIYDALVTMWLLLPFVLYLTFDELSLARPTA